MRHSLDLSKQQQQREQEQEKEQEQQQLLLPVQLRHVCVHVLFARMLTIVSCEQRLQSPPRTSSERTLCVRPSVCPSFRQLVSVSQRPIVPSSLRQSLCPSVCRSFLPFHCQSQSLSQSQPQPQSSILPHDDTVFGGRRSQPSHPGRWLLLLASFNL
ncbi:hypothetical protein AWZ03_004501 [Drosophila navojoa]|uniref:Uncharacterized protein n=1 Tax=Drosophila navojoa TaxID=7232 RepID=A0A484BJH8_DRONA|nr:hypothetical protein AWZ03_004501 [Drosophila navojoa]